MPWAEAMITLQRPGAFLMGAVGMPLGGSHNGGIRVFKRKGIVVYSGASPILFGGVRGRGIFDEEGRASKLRDIFK